MGKIALIGAVMLAAGTLAAETVLDYNPGKPAPAQWKYWTWRTMNPNREKPRTAGKEGAVSFVKITPDMRVGVNVTAPKFAALGSGNFSASVLFRTTGNQGFTYLFFNGAGSGKVPGVRLCICPDGKGSMRPSLFFCFTDKGNDWIDIGTPLKDGMPQNEWCVVTVTIDRAGKACIYFNGELLQSKDIGRYKNAKAFPDGFTSFMMDGYGYEMKNGVATPVEGAVKTDVARIVFYDEVLPLAKVEQEADTLLESVDE